ncbi:plasmid pRiA4b ORF-3 family protein [Bradyrhizobium brasilense]|uniref:plasmid pRiA4b ORF-3 family protein n=1 Tax=Bradyrhizobium brasilense TaxID=1419277 RepID=UPI002877BBC5|nr:plasmid pRiA4b ORF-3 family protein [Bradyrhizobium brasilense]MCP3420133.1 plasmid pRiA4b ORF-3 family protein [Bradyrhizobium brasilense]
MSRNTTAVRIKVTLKDVRPEVMRCLVVPLTLRLDRLHLTLQAAFGWTNSHLFEFHAGEERWGIPDPDGDFGPQPIDASKAPLSDIVRETGAKTIHYLYDFGDSWDHVIKLEKWFDNTTTEGLPLLLEAAGRCPPEDVGGAPGYAEYLDAISDPAHPEHERMHLWGPEKFDPNVVDRKALEAAVNALSGIWKPRRHKLRSKWPSSADRKGRSATFTVECRTYRKKVHRVLPSCVVTLAKCLSAVSVSDVRRPAGAPSLSLGQIKYFEYCWGKPINPNKRHPPRTERRNKSRSFTYGPMALVGATQQMFAGQL